MASIDWGTLALGALIGVGCKKQLKAASNIAATTAASLASAASAAIAEVASATKTQSAEEAAAQQWLQRIDQAIEQKLAGSTQTGTGAPTGQTGNGQPGTGAPTGQTV